MSELAFEYVKAVRHLPTEQRHAIEEYVNSLTWRNAQLSQIAEAADEITVDAGFDDKTVVINRAAYEVLCKTLIDTGWWSPEAIEVERKHAMDVDIE